MKGKGSYQKIKSYNEFKAKLCTVYSHLSLLNSIDTYNPRKVEIQCTSCKKIFQTNIWAIFQSRKYLCCNLINRNFDNCFSIEDKNDLFIEKLKVVSPNIIPLESYKGNCAKIKCLCEKCNNEFMVAPVRLLKGKGCIYCNNKYTGGSYTLEQFSIFIQRNSPQWELLDLEYIPYEKSLIKCKNCGTNRYATKQKLRLGQVNCQTCKSGRKSNPEKKIESYLKSKEIPFIYQKTFNDLKSNFNINLRFDFYLPDYNLCIEYDGQGHFDPNFYLNKTGIIDHTNDSLKEKYCNINNIKLLRIPYWDQKDMIEYIDFSLEELKNFNSVITNNYRGKEYSHLGVNV